MTEARDDLTEQNERDAKQRAKMLKMSKAEIASLLLNPDGLRRLLDISDAEWEAAALEDEHAP